MMSRDADAVSAAAVKTGYHNQVDGVPTFPSAPGKFRGWSHKFGSRESVWAASTCAIVLLCIVLANPFANAGFDDDWSYSHVALRFAETGRVHYNGWGSPMILFQTIWGAAWIRLFGFSFDILRFATLPFSLGFVWLVYALGRTIGLRRDLACFGALAVGTSPLFLPLAASFMTEAYACFFTALCIYAAIRSADAPGSWTAMIWLWVLALSGIVGGSDRQTVWVAPLALIPYLFWMRRSDRAFSAHAAATYVVCLGSLALLATHFKPPYALFALAGPELRDVIGRQSAAGFGRLISLCLSCMMLALPGLLCFTRLWKRLGGLEICLLAFGSVAVVFVFIYSMGVLGIVPFIGGILSQHGILLPGQDLLGYRPTLLHPILRVILSVLIVFSVFAVCLLCKAFCKNALGKYGSIFLAFSVPYAALLLPGLLMNISYDRYVLPILPLLMFLLLSCFQRLERQAIPAAAWGSLLIFAGYGIAITHDYASGLRARVQAARILEQHGIPRSRVSAGLEYDAWTQLLRTGQLKGVMYDTTFEWNYSDRFWFWNFTTALKPEYVVTYARSPNLGNNSISSVAYTAWTPPFQRSVAVIRREDLPKSKLCVTPGICSLPY
jgi:hypothetical protein